MKVLIKSYTVTNNQNTEEKKPAENAVVTVAKESINHAGNKSKLQITVLDVGQGLSVLMCSNEE